MEKVYVVIYERCIVGDCSKDLYAFSDYNSALKKMEELEKKIDLNDYHLAGDKGDYKRYLDKNDEGRVIISCEELNLLNLSSND